VTYASCKLRDERKPGGVRGFWELGDATYESCTELRDERKPGGVRGLWELGDAMRRARPVRRVREGHATALASDWARLAPTTPHIHF
jgi:hypothetical protein